jgi:cell wall-associated NlpC family hydrolase
MEADSPDRRVPDKRINAYRDDLAAESLRAKVDVPNYTKGEMRQVVATAAPLRHAPRFDAVLKTQVLHGESVVVYDENEGWAWAQADRDAYVGYIPSDALKNEITTPTHRVNALCTHIYPAPDIKVPPLDLLSMNAHLSVAEEMGSFSKLTDGRFALASHLVPVANVAKDFVSVAQKFLGIPYLWGGRTSSGLDCSALIQLSLQSAGIACPRDADMQEAALGTALPDPHDQSAYARGDLIFWSGHVGVMLDETRLLHANAHHMATAIEPVGQAIARIADTEGQVTSVRRGADDTEQKN